MVRKMKMDFCSLCVYKGLQVCKKCDHFERFHPRQELSKYFRRNNQGDTLNLWSVDCNKLEPTATIKIGSSYYCPYCGDFSFIVTNPAQKSPYKRNEVTGHCCFCEGALAELEYKKKRMLLELLHYQQLQNLKETYEPELKFHTDELLASSAENRGLGESLRNNGYFHQSAQFIKAFNLIK